MDQMMQDPFVVDVFFAFFFFLSWNYSVWSAIVGSPRSSSWE